MAVTPETAALVRLREIPRGAREPLCQLCKQVEWAGGLGRFVNHHIEARGSGGTNRPELDEAPNLALLHDGCHRWAHDNPREARARGLIVSKLGKVSQSVSLTARQSA